MEDLPGQVVAALLQVGLLLDLTAVAGLVRQAQDVQGLGDPSGQVRQLRRVRISGQGEQAKTMSL